MKKILIILFILISFGVNAQTWTWTTSGVPTKVTFLNGGTSFINFFQFPRAADTSFPLLAGMCYWDSLTNQLMIVQNGEFATYAGGGGGGGISEIIVTPPLTGGTITSTGTIGIPQASTVQSGYLAEVDFNTFAGKISLPQLSDSLAWRVPIYDSGIIYLTPFTFDTAIAALWPAISAKQAQLNGTGFVKATGTTISYDNTTYYPASNPNGYITSSFATANLVPYTGATGNVNLGGNSLTDAGGHPSIFPHSRWLTNFEDNAVFSWADSVTGFPYIAIGDPFHNANFTSLYIDDYKQRIILNSDSVIVASISGTGTRMVIASPTGELGTQAIPSGTVTSVGTGYGLTGGPITTTGTIVFDSATAFTRYASTQSAGYGLFYGGRTYILDSATFATYLNSTLAVGYGILHGGRTFTLDTGTSFAKLASTFSAGYGLSFGGRTYKVDTATLATYIRSTIPSSGGGGLTQTFHTITDGAAFIFDGTTYANQLITLGAARTFTLANLVNGQQYVFKVLHSISAYQLTWGTTVIVDYSGAGVPPQSTSASAIDYYYIQYDGTNIHISYSLNAN